MRNFARFFPKCYFKILLSSLSFSDTPTLRVPSILDSSLLRSILSSHQDISLSIFSPKIDHPYNIPFHSYVAIDLVINKFLYSYYTYKYRRRVADIRTRITYYILLRLENAKLENVIFSILRLYHFFDLSQLFLLYIFYRGGVLKRLFLRALRALSDLKVGFICFLKILQNQNIHTDFHRSKGWDAEKKIAHSYTHPQKYVPSFRSNMKI